MSETAIIAELTPLFRDVLGDPSLVLTPETQAADVPEWDLASHIMLVVAIEQAFGIRFKTAEIEELRNVGDLAKLVAAKKG